MTLYKGLLAVLNPPAAKKTNKKTKTKESKK